MIRNIGLSVIIFDMASFNDKLTPLEKRGVESVDGFGYEIYQTVVEEFKRIEYNGTVNHRRIKDKLTQYIVAFDGKNIDTLSDVFSLSFVDPYDGRKDVEDFTDSEIHPKMIVFLVMSNMKEYVSINKIASEIPVNDTEENRNILFILDNSYFDI